MEPIDAAFRRLEQIFPDLVLDSNNVTEADVRLRIVDRMLLEVLGWRHDDVRCEKRASGAAGFADYTLGETGRTRLVVEAKRDNRELGCENRNSGRPYKLDGPVFKPEGVREGIDQAIRYCGEFSAELACVTNGREWVVFRGSRMGDGLPVRGGMAFIFPELAAVRENFKLFHTLLCRDSVTSRGFVPEFAAAENSPIRMNLFNKAVKAPGTARAVPQSPLAADIDKIMSSFFRRLAGDADPEMIEACFVESEESRQAERQLIRIAESLAIRATDLDSGEGVQLQTLIERTAHSKTHAFAVIVGQKGSGKSTFIRRFFDQVLPEQLLRRCVVLNADLRSNPGDPDGLVKWLDRQLVENVEERLFSGSPAFKEITGIFFDEYTRLKKGPWSVVHETDFPRFQEKFGQHIEDLRTSDPHKYLAGLIRHIHGNRGLVPVLIFDNADHFDIDFQQRVYQYARSLYEDAVCLVLLPITDRTSWQLAKHGALQSYDHESFFLPTPNTKLVLRKRIEFIESRIDKEGSSDGQELAPKYFTDRGISMSIKDLKGFARALQQIFLQTASVADWIGELANFEIRRALNITTKFVVSPHLGVADLATAYLSNTGVALRDNVAERALILNRYDIYPSGMHDFVQNVYSMDVQRETSPLLGLRILQALEGVPRDDREGAFIEKDRLVAVLQMMLIDEMTAKSWIGSLLSTGLILNYDPSIQTFDEAGLLEISPAGKIHLRWSQTSFEYLSAMAVVTPLLDLGAHEAITRAYAHRRFRTVAATFAEYLAAEDELHCNVPSHDSFASQQRVVPQLRGLAEKWSRPRPATAS